MMTESHDNRESSDDKLRSARSSARVCRSRNSTQLIVETRMHVFFQIILVISGGDERTGYLIDSLERTKEIQRLVDVKRADRSLRYYCIQSGQPPGNATRCDKKT